MPQRFWRKSAAERMCDPARKPRPPEYTLKLWPMANSQEKYTTLLAYCGAIL